MSLSRAETPGVLYRTCPTMIAGPSSPGVGAPVNHPAGKAPGGVSSVPSFFRPRAIRVELRPTDGITTRDGTERIHGVTCRTCTGTTGVTLGAPSAPGAGAIDAGAGCDVPPRRPV